MTATINWTIEQLERKTADGFVTTAHWRCTAQDGDFSGTVYGSCGFSGDLNTPYDQLTQEQVLGWVWESVNKEDTEAAVQAQVDAQKTPETASGLPWAE